jgi:3-oxoacyl-[acyl-carrier-protein] synthase-3
LAAILGIEWMLGSRRVSIAPAADGVKRAIFVAGKEQRGPRAMAQAVVARLLDRFPEQRSRIGLVINCSFAPSEYGSWSLAAWTQHQSGIKNAHAFDIYQGCVGFLQGLSIAANAIATGVAKSALVFSSEWFEELLPHRRQRGQHWSDGSAAVLVTGHSTKTIAHILACAFRTDGRFVSLTRARAGNHRGVKWAEEYPLRYRYFATRREWTQFIEERDRGYLPTLRRALRTAGHTLDHLDCIVQNNIYPRVTERMGIIGVPTSLDLRAPPEGHVGTTDIPRLLDIGIDQGWLKPGHLAALVTGGVGWTWGSVIVKMAKRRKARGPS